MNADSDEPAGGRAASPEKQRVKMGERLSERISALTSGRRFEVATRVLLTALLLGGALFLLRYFGRWYPVKDWLFWVYLRVWVCALVFGVACLCAGNALLKLTLRRSLPLFEHFAFAFALGSFVFYLEVFLAGLLGLLRPWFFFVAPLLLIAWGGRSTFALLQRARRHFRSISALRVWPRPSLLEWSLLAAGLVAILALYFPILTPENVAYDARWYHLPLAEHYVAVGAIQRSPEGWLPAAYPHLVSHLYTWALLMPGGRYFDHVELCAHLEFIVFLATLPGVSALARRLLPRVRLRGAWVAIFLFPEIFIYDSCLSVGADHFAAMWAPLIMIAFLRMVQQRSWQFAILMAAAMSGALCTKFTAGNIVLFPVLATLAWTAFGMAWPRGVERARYAQVLGAAAATGLVATSPHWLKNLIWYGDPIYPTLHRFLNVRPWTPDFSAPFENWFYPPNYHPTRDLAGVRETLRALVTYSFIPNDWWTSHRDVPIFGSLGTLSLAWLPFLRRTKRIWLLQLALHVGLFFWFWVHHFDRYLQTLLPWMGAALAATLYLLWQKGYLVRVGLVLLLGVQVVWGGDAYFLPIHAMSTSAIKKSMDLLASGYDQNYTQRYSAPFYPYADAAKDLPPNAKVLVHEMHVHWALQRASVSDWQGTQAGISYGRLGGVRETYRFLKQLGVTHVFWDGPTSKGYDTLAADLNFFALVHFVPRSPNRIGGKVMAALPDAAPPRDYANTRVLFMGCAEAYANGIYDLNQLVASDLDPRKIYPKPREPLPRLPEPAALDAAMEGAALMVVDPGCYPRLPAAVQRAHFERIARRNRLELYARPLVETTESK